jgi:hypothetical protein
VCIGAAASDEYFPIEGVHETTERTREMTVGAYHALYAGVVDRGVGTIDCRDLGPSFHGMATTREYPFDPRLTVSGVIGKCDAPHLLVALDDRDLRVERTTD